MFSQRTLLRKPIMTNLHCFFMSTFIILMDIGNVFQISNLTGDGEMRKRQQDCFVEHEVPADFIVGSISLLDLVCSNGDQSQSFLDAVVVNSVVFVLHSQGRAQAYGVHM